MSTTTNNAKRYFQIHTKKGWFVAEGSNDENVVIDLIHDRKYSLKKEDVLEEVTPKFVVDVLKNDSEEIKNRYTKIRGAFYFIVPLSVPLSVLFDYTIELSLFVILSSFFLMLSIIKYSRGLQNERRKIFEKNYYIALKEIK